MLDKKIIISVSAALLLGLAACSDESGSNNSDDDPADTGTQDTSVMQDSGTDTEPSDTGGEETGMPEDTGQIDSGETDTGNADTGGDGPSFDQFATDLPSTYREAACRSAFECPEGQDPGLSRFLFSRFATQADCEANLPDFYLPVDIPSQSEIDDGQTTYNPAMAQQCLDALSQILAGDACTLALEAEPRIESCHAAFSGSTADGEACLGDYQCESGLCDPNATNCYGECVSAGALGDTCGTNAVPGCKPWLTCQQDANGDEVCVEVGASASGESCTNDFGCEGSTECDLEGDPKQCQTTALKNDGDTCAASDFCAAGTQCVGADRFTDGTCTAPKAMGDTCAETDECQWGLYCDESSGQCSETLAEGADCEDSDACGFRSDCSGSGPLKSCETRDPDSCTLP